MICDSYLIIDRLTYSGVKALIRKGKYRFIEEIMTKNIVTVASTLSVREISRIMAREELTGLAVFDPGRGILGIVTECDVLRRFGERNWELLTAEEIMTPNVEAVRPETTLEQAAEVMQKRNIHRLLVLGRNLSEPEMPIGIINASDIVWEIGKESY